MSIKKEMNIDFAHKSIYIILLHSINICHVNICRVFEPKSNTDSQNLVHVNLLKKLVL